MLVPVQIASKNPTQVVLKNKSSITYIDDSSPGNYMVSFVLLPVLKAGSLCMLCIDSVGAFLPTCSILVTSVHAEVFALLVLGSPGIESNMLWWNIE